MKRDIGVRERLRPIVRFQQIWHMGDVGGLVAYHTVTELMDARGRLRRIAFRYQLVRRRLGLADESLVRVDNCEGEPHLHLLGAVRPLGSMSPEDGRMMFLEYCRSFESGMKE